MSSATGQSGRRGGGNGWGGLGGSADGQNGRVGFFVVEVDRDSGDRRGVLGHGSPFLLFFKLFLDSGFNGVLVKMIEVDRGHAWGGRLFLWSLRLRDHFHLLEGDVVGEELLGSFGILGSDGQKGSSLVLGPIVFFPSGVLLFAGLPSPTLL